MIFAVGAWVWMRFRTRLNHCVVCSVGGISGSWPLMKPPIATRVVGGSRQLADQLIVAVLVIGEREVTRAQTLALEALLDRGRVLGVLAEAKYSPSLRFDFLDGCHLISLCLN